MGELLADAGPLRLAVVPAPGRPAGRARGQFAGRRLRGGAYGSAESRRIRRAVGRGRSDVRTLDALPGRGAGTVDLAGHLRRIRHAAAGAFRRYEPAGGQGADPAAGRLHHAGRHCGHRLCGLAAGPQHVRRGETDRGEGVRPDQRTYGGPAGGRDERLFQPGSRRGPGTADGGHGPAFRLAAGHAGRHAGRSCDQCGLLPLPERQEPHFRRLRQDASVGQRPPFLRDCGSRSSSDWPWAKVSSKRARWWRLSPGASSWRST